jgi:acetolactate synthase-1/2/3 large subunit
MKVSAGEYIARFLKNEKVEVVFGIIDGTYQGLIVGLKKEGIRLITPRHETSAAHMAGAYARVTGKLGVCIASNGPGVANILPGVTVENAEGNRVLLITSSRRVGIGYPDRGGTYQYFDQVGVISNISKYSVTTPHIERVPELIKKALRKSYTGRPGVVHFDLPESLMNSKFDFPKLQTPDSYRLNYRLRPTKKQVMLAAEILLKAEMPIIHAGSGVLHSGAFAELSEIAELLKLPVVTSWAARGVLSEESDYAIPMVHIDVNNKARKEADAVLVLGSRLGETDWWGKAPYWNTPDKQKIIQVDLDADIIGNNRPVDAYILADIKAFLQDLIAEVKTKVPGQFPVRTKFNDELKKAVKKDREKLDKKLDDKKSPMITAHVPNVADKVFPKDSIVVFDGGNSAVWGNFFHKVSTPNTILSTFKFGMLGAGVGQALGASAAFPERQTYCIIGDGAMGFHPQEIETAIRNDLKPIFFVICDKQWGMVKMTQQFAMKPIKTMIKKELSSEETINTDLGEIQFDKLAESMGAHGERVSSPEELQPAIERCIKADKCAVIHVDVDHVKHMWAPGLMKFKAMHQEPKGK